MNFNLSRFSIHKQILIGYIPVLSVLAFLALSSFKNFKTFDQNFNALQDITEEKLVFLEIEKHFVELQRNVLVHSYVGYRGILKKIEHLQKDLEKKFDQLRPIVSKNADIKDRFDRMLEHYRSYKKAFERAVVEKHRLKKLSISSMEPLIKSVKNYLREIKNALNQGNFEDAYIISQIELDFFKAISNISLFEKAPDSVIINGTRILISSIQDRVTLLKKASSEAHISQNLEDLSRTIKEFQDIFKEITRVNRIHLNLINVVLAGKAAGINTLFSELDDLITQHSKSITIDIKNSIKRSQKHFIILSILAGIIGVLSSIFISMGIANPVRAMAKTLYRLAKGNADIEIPGQRRRDEVGQMAKAANEFKIMAKNLESQTKELEEFAYRTSHDLRSPLVSSIGLLKLTQETINSGHYDKAQDSITLVAKSLEKLEVLIKDILELTKIKNVSEEETDINFETILDEALEKLSHMEDFERLDIKKNLEFTNNFMSKKSRVVLVLENLLSNAVKYQNREKKDSYIKISTYDTLDNIILEVEDNGLGIPKKYQKDLFSMFKRFHPKVSFGSGLGLYMMKKSADILGGDLVYEDIETGSRFKLFIPAKNKEAK